MTMKKLDDNSNPDGFGHFMARETTLMDCQPGRRTSSKSNLGVLLTLGHADASIDQLWLNKTDARHLLHLLALALRYENESFGHVTPGDTIKKWVAPHSVLRAKLSVEGNLADAVIRLRHDLPEVAEYVDLQLSNIRRRLTRRAFSAIEVPRLITRLATAMLIIADAARHDT